MLPLYGPLMGAQASVAAPRRRGLFDRLADRLVPGDGLSDEDKSKLFRNGLLQAGLLTLATPTGTGSALMGVSRGLLGGLQGVQEGAENLERQRYNAMLRQRQEAEYQQQQAAAQRQAKISELQRLAYNPDGSFNEAGLAELRKFDPVAAAQFVGAVTPEDNRPSFIREIDYLRQNPDFMPIAQQVYDLKNPTNLQYVPGLGQAYDPQRNQFVPVGGAPAQGGAPQPPAPAVNGDPKMDAIVQAANAMRVAGVPEEQIDAWAQGIARQTPGVQVGDAPAARLPGSPTGNPVVDSPEAPLEITGPQRAWWRTATPEQRQDFLNREGGGIEKADPAALRKEFDTAIREYRIIEDSVAKVQSASQAGTAAGDMSLIFAYMKMLDPASTVREGEYASAQNTTGVPGQIINLYNRAKDGQFLTPQQRQDFVRQAESIAGQKRKDFETTYSRYTRLAERAGLSPEDVVFDPAGQQAVAPGTVEDGYRFKGGNPADPNSWEKL